MSDFPEIDPVFDQPYIEAFYMLDGSRQMGMGVGTIPLSEISDLWDRIRLGEWEDFVQIIQAADTAFLEAYNTDPKNQPKQEKS